MFGQMRALRPSGQTAQAAKTKAAVKRGKRRKRAPKRPPFPTDQTGRCRRKKENGTEFGGEPSPRWERSRPSASGFATSDPLYRPGRILPGGSEESLQAQEDRGKIESDEIRVRIPGRSPETEDDRGHEPLPNRRKIASRMRSIPRERLRNHRGRVSCNSSVTRRLRSASKPHSGHAPSFAMPRRSYPQR